MTVAEMVLAYVKVLLWPAVAAIGIWLIRDRLPGISRVETPMGAVEFVATAQRAHEQINEETEPAARRVAHQGRGDAFDFASVLAEERPLESIVAAGSLVEAAYYYAAAAGRTEGVTVPVLESLARLRVLRENALREPNVVTAAGAREFVQASKLTAVHLGISWFPGVINVPGT
ncbi:hypothetical protein [Streptomyces sp. NBC_00568]|uniref:hypothetical protein n=1 Tax=Streptomyces sp. NBC_00568 TaxID=2975779 RepID=UPI002258FD06|nr:hypothetical protein [Streptomyces sp. NBC_00568]MCX4988437.1 hypothetical protein [Streptomyces sp. NBC_00568]